MYRYVPNEHLQRRFLRKYVSYDHVKAICHEYLGRFDFSMYRTIQRLKGFTYYSPVKLREVPVQGMLLPVAMFKETKVE